MNTMHKRNMFLITTLVWASLGVAHAGFRITVNKPFATRANGPVGFYVAWASLVHRMIDEAFSTVVRHQRFRKEGPAGGAEDAPAPT